MLKNPLSFKNAIPILLILLLSSVLLICREKTQSKDIQIAQKSQPTDATDDKDHIAVLPVRDIYDPPILSTAEMSIVDSLLHKAVDRFNKDIHISRPDQFIDLSKYKRQYIVSFDKTKGRVVYVNCMCRVLGDEWKTREIGVMDGGSCYFNLMVKLKAKKYFQFTVNGEA